MQLNCPMSSLKSTGLCYTFRRPIHTPPPERSQTRFQLLPLLVLVLLLDFKFILLNDLESKHLIARLPLLRRLYKRLQPQPIRLLQPPPHNERSDLPASLFRMREQNIQDFMKTFVSVKKPGFPFL